MFVFNSKFFPNPIPEITLEIIKPKGLAVRV